MKRIATLVTLILLSGVFSLQAQTDRGTKSDPEAAAMMKKVVAKYQVYSSMKVDFTMTTEVSGKDPQVQNGSMWMKGEKFKVESGDYLVVCDNTTYWFYTKTDKSLQINYFEDEEDLVNPTELFKIYEKDFLVFKGERSGSTQSLELTPKDKTKPFHKIRLKFDVNTNSIQGAIFFFKNSPRLYIDINSVETKGRMSDDEFKFDSTKHPVEDEVDLRE